MEVNLETVYLVCFFLGVGFAIFSGLLGGVFGDFHSGHADASGGGHDVGGVHFPILSPVTISTFLAAFGGTGIILLKAVDKNMPLGIHLSASIGAGLVIALGVAFVFWRLFIKTQTTSAPKYSDLLGLEAQVSLTIPREGVGQITYTYSNIIFTASAKSVGNEEVKSGSVVKIAKIVGDTFYVEKRS